MICLATFSLAMTLIFLYAKFWHRVLNCAIGYLEMVNPLLGFLILLCTQLIVIQDYSKQDVNF